MNRATLKYTTFALAILGASVAALITHMSVLGATDGAPVKCGGQDHGPAMLAQQSDESDAIREVVARYFLAKSKNAKSIVFISVDEEKDPSDNLLKRLSDVKAVLRKGSRGKVNPGYGRTAPLRVDRETGETGGLLWISTIERTSKTTVEVEAEHGFTRLNGEGGTLILQKVKGRWKVVRLKDWGFAFSNGAGGWHVAI